MKHLFFLSVCLTSSLIFSCKKDSKADQNRSVLIGTWDYVSSDRSETYYNADGSVNYTNASVYVSGNTTRNHITFMNNSKVIMVEDGFGLGLAGSLFVDTVSYRVTDNAILVDFPAGNNFYLYPNDNYPAYTDTLAIQFLSSDSLSFTRRYHYKYITKPTELKTTTARLRKE